jgi:TetR/AcrR family transcriptional repressor of nem operon
MRYEKGHKEATRNRIIDTAYARFRKDGIDKVGVAELMAEAGLTHGGFYSHFKSKEDLVRVIMEEAGVRSRARFAQQIEEGGIEAWIRNYLSAYNRDHPEKSCVVAALGSELSRHSKASREVFTKNQAKAIAALSAQLPSAWTPDQKALTAYGIYSTLVGALQIARTVTRPEVSDQILEAGIASALTLAQIKTPSS